MASRKRDVPDWKEFERLVARIEKDAGPLGLTVVSPDRMPLPADANTAWIWQRRSRYDWHHSELRNRWPISGRRSQDQSDVMN
jgi:hypothetical protein